MVFDLVRRGFDEGTSFGTRGFLVLGFPSLASGMVALAGVPSFVSKGSFFLRGLFGPVVFLAELGLANLCPT